MYLIRACIWLHCASLERSRCTLECRARVAVRLKTVANLLTILVGVVPDNRLRESTTQIYVCIGLECEVPLIIQEHCFSLEGAYSITGVHTIRGEGLFFDGLNHGSCLDY